MQKPQTYLKYAIKPKQLVKLTRFQFLKREFLFFYLHFADFI